MSPVAEVDVTVPTPLKTRLLKLGHEHIAISFINPRGCLPTKSLGRMKSIIKITHAVSSEAVCVSVHNPKLLDRKV